MSTADSSALAERIAAIASDRKAIDVRVIDLRGIVSYTDFFVICSGNTERQTKAIHDAIYEELKHADDRLLPRRVMELRGLEPLTYALPARRSVQLSYSPRKLKIYRKIETRPLGVLGRREPQVNRTAVCRERDRKQV